MSDIIRDITEIARCGSQYKGEKLAQLSLKTCHASYLMEICHCPGISQDKLSQRICINKSNVARQAAILEEAGFILRKPSPGDKRVMELYPTEKTLALQPQVHQILQSWEGLVTAGLSQEEMDCICAVLQRMKRNAVGGLSAD